MARRRWYWPFGGRGKAPETAPVAPARRTYDAAQRSPRNNAWLRSGSSGNAEVRGAAPLLRGASRDLVRNNPHAASAVSRLSGRVIGTGIRPRCKSKGKLRLTPAMAETVGMQAGEEVEISKYVQALWDEWAVEACVSDDLDIYGIQHQAFVGLVESGESFIRRRIRGLDEGYAVPLQLEVLEADMLDASVDGVTSDQGGKTVQGVAFDAIGRRTGYWVLAEHPGEMQSFWPTDGRAGTGSTFVPESRLVHLWDAPSARPGQVRGIPWLTPVAQSLWDLDQYTDAERVRKKTEACVAGFIEGGDPAIGAEDGIGSTAVDSDGDVVDSLRPGLIASLPNGKQIRFNQPVSVGGYPEYVRRELQTIAAGARMTYELLSGDLSQVNYSSIRAGLVEFQALVERLQWLVIVQRLCRRVWGWFIETAQLAGLLPAGRYPVEWTPPRFEHVDRLKEALADITEIRGGLTTRSEVIARRGYDPVAVMEEYAEDMAAVDALQITLDSDPRRTSRAGTAQDTWAVIEDV